MHYPKAILIFIPGVISGTKAPQYRRCSRRFYGTLGKKQINSRSASSRQELLREPTGKTCNSWDEPGETPVHIELSDNENYGMYFFNCHDASIEKYE